MNESKNIKEIYLQVGSKIPIKSPVDDEIIKCEILSIKNDMYYVHFNHLNKRYDTWISADSFIFENLNKIELPKKKKKVEKKLGQTLEEELRIKNFDNIVLGKYSINTWYFSPYPKEVIKNKTVFICEYCLFYFSGMKQLKIHCTSCKLRHPPGLMVYQDNDNNLTFFEVDGFKQNNYCRNLSLLSKLFLDHKSLVYDVDAFLFYVLCRKNEKGYYKIVGYFSKEKFSEQGYNLACILCLPSEQRKGYGKILIDFSYMLSKKENLISGPEKPLSDLGLLSYRSYWLDCILEYINENNNLNIKDISMKTHIAEDDIIGTLLANKMIKYYNDGLIIILDKNMKEKMRKRRQHKVYENVLIKNY
ncbi:ESA1 [Hepatospora eriocheir]|uniref:Histone acetyltransferase n=1 Tax=Hepatospora eriocheir TaxID=1081669 RepID=A0A1X0QHS3_9MICR|nr:ESA1 [Hepatospora eriocheir]